MSPSSAAQITPFQLVSSPESNTQEFQAPTPNEQSTTDQTLRKRATILEPRRSSDEAPLPERIPTRHTTRLSSMLIPERKVGPAPGVFQSIKTIILASWLNVLLVFIPISWALNFALKDSVNNKDTIVFIMSFLAIIPLAKLLAFATDELSIRVGQTLAGLLNATLGNAVELIVAIIALVKCELRVVQASLVGSILSNLLLVLGMCFFAGGLKYSEQGFGASATQLNCSLLTISVIAVLLPAAFHLSFNGTDEKEASDILSVSHGVAIILLFIYGGYLVFQLYSHTALYQDSGEHVIQSIKYAPKPQKVKAIKDKDNAINSEKPRSGSPSQEGEDSSSAESVKHDVECGTPQKQEEEIEIPKLGLWVTIGLLAVVTVLVAVTAEWLVDSIDGLTDTGRISKEFVGIILLPIVGNAAEHATAVTVSVKDKLQLSLGVAVGSSIQIALFVIPFIVTLAWILGKPLSLLFDPYESITLFLAVLTVNYVVQDGKSNWLEGMILMCLYVILGVTFWFYEPADTTSFFQC